MIRLFLFSFLFCYINCDCVYPSNSIFCDFPEPSPSNEEGFYDGFCQTDRTSSDDVFLREEIVTHEESPDSQHYHFKQTYKFPKQEVTRANLTNFGKHRGSTSSINIANRDGSGSVTIYVDVYTGKAIEMHLDVYGHDW